MPLHVMSLSSVNTTTKFFYTAHISLDNIYINILLERVSVSMCFRANAYEKVAFFSPELVTR